MAIISSYPYDLTINDADAWVGTDSVRRQTKQYTAEAISNYLNTSGKVSVGGKMAYKFTTARYGDFGTFALQIGQSGEPSFSNITSLKIAKLDLSKKSTAAWIEYLVGNEILLSSQKDLGAFGHYKIVSYEVDEDSAHFYNITLEYIGGNGSIVADDYYDIVDFQLSSTSDKTFKYIQSTPEAVWTVQHNLGKFPSVTTANNNSIEVKGEVEYVDENNLTITFSAGFSGKAYLN